MELKLGLPLIITFSMLFSGCASVVGTGKLGSENSPNPSSLTVDQKSDARHILGRVPAEAVLERLEMLDLKGREWAYIAFTDIDTEIGGLIFIGNKLHGTVSRRDAQAFYSCRSYVTMTQTHWAKDASEWMTGLYEASVPAVNVNLHFSGKSTPQSIKEVTDSKILAQLGSLMSMGTNPLRILKKLSSVNDESRERDRLERLANALRIITPGNSEQTVVDALAPEEVFYGESGLVLAYPGFAFEFYIRAGSVKVAQQPSFYSLSRRHTALFYVPNGQWDQCSPGRWRNFLPAEKAVSFRPANPR